MTAMNTIKTDDMTQYVFETFGQDNITMYLRRSPGFNRVLPSSYFGTAQVNRFAKGAIVQNVSGPAGTMAQLAKALNVVAIDLENDFPDERPWTMADVHELAEHLRLIEHECVINTQWVQE